MIRDALVGWLLRSALLCRLGLHMPVAGSKIVDDKIVWDENWHCAVCEKDLGSLHA